MSDEELQNESEGHKKARLAAEKLRAETESAKEEATAKEQERLQQAAQENLGKVKEKSAGAIATLDYSRYAGIGMKDITAEDIRPPIMFLVQGIKNKSELVDAEGNECPDGALFLKGFNEILEDVDAYFIYIKKDHYQVKEDENPVWDGSRMYRTVAVRKSDMMPFAINFIKSSLNAVSDLITASKSRNLPMFVFNTTIKVVKATNKKGIEYFKTVVQVKETESDVMILNKLFKLAQGFDQQEIVIDEDEEKPTAAEAEAERRRQEDEAAMPVGEPPVTGQDVSDDIPF